ncbi:hypothetical protein BY996DRAFT_6430599 [Phakopsora pachyrhizi]|uniref:F-BAR domain-containing protein n=1 Tax=Phakopsora pachyrhizi TaxID=170000 RepID=A0AAV0AMA1_PHAPC|nr:hypothetical protein BY996DRAFT_6430599 [Phakopsora pachyrhizi]CAH7668912.1 hypothetical protein PPACK8108_LOCUS3485 [Phakopsora pachyrhizi]
MVEELRNWYKERAALEADYSRRLQKLAKSNIFYLMRYEGDGLRNCLERVREMTIRSAHSHAELGGTFKSGLESKVSEFVNRRDGVRRNPQISIEKLHKRALELKSLQEKARKKFEADAIAVSGYNAQLHLVQGREMDKVSSKLDKAQGSIGITEKEYKVLTKSLEETSEEWNFQWKSFCDLVQDLEEDRIEFMRSSLWDYTNGVSTVCALEDKDCECVRKVIEKCDLRQDIRCFIQYAGSGNELCTAPLYIDYVKGEFDSLTAGKPPRPKLAKFTRNSCRDGNIPKLGSGVAIKELVDAIVAGPVMKTPAPEIPLPEHSQTIYQAKQQLKRGGNIAEIVASNSIPSSQLAPASAPTQTSSRIQIKAEPVTQTPFGPRNPNHHQSFHGSGILVNQSPKSKQIYFGHEIFDRPLPLQPQECLQVS